MTREEAIKTLKENLCGQCAYDSQCMESCDIRSCDNRDAIRALEQEPCEDAIRRADAEALFRNARSKLNPSDYKTADEFNTRDLMLLNAEQFIHPLPSVRPQEPKTGHWIEHPEIETSTPEYLMFYECSECGDKQCFCKSDIHKKHFCNNCGAKMVEPQESDDKG